MQCMLQNILKEVIFWALLASGDFHNNEVQRPRKALLADAWSEILAGLSELGLTVLTSLWEHRRHQDRIQPVWASKLYRFQWSLAHVSSHHVVVSLQGIRKN